MRKNQKIYSPEERLKIFEEFERSGLNVTEFGRQKGIPEPTIRNWIRKKKAGKRIDEKSKQGPHTIEARKQAIEAYLKSGLTQDEFSRTWGVSAGTLNRWIKIYRSQGMKGLEQPTFREGAKKRGSKGIPKSVRDQIIEVKRENPQFGLRQVKGFLNRFRGVDAAVGTINKTIKEEKLEVKPPRRRRRRSADKPRRFERAKAMQLWQTDITYFSLTKHQQRCYLTVFLDDHSRYIVGWRLGLRQTGEFVMEALLDGIQRFGRPQEVLSDQGRQYFAWRGKTEFQNLLRRQGIQHVVARSHHPQTVGKCERLWKTIKDEFWDRLGPLDLQEAQERLSHYINHYNHFRPNQGIDNLVPADRFFGAENEVRAALEKAMSENEIRLATGERPRPPTFLVGQIGGQAISLHGETGKLVLQVPGEERREISYETIECAGEAGEEGQDEAEEKDAGAAQVCPTREDVMGPCDARAEAEGAELGDGDSRVLDGLHHEAGSLQALRGAACEDLAAVTAGDIGYAGGVTSAAQDEGQGDTDESERRSKSATQEDQGTRGDDQEAGSLDHGLEIDAGVPGRGDPGGDQGEGRG